MIREVYIKNEFLNYLEERGLWKQFEKAKNHIKNGRLLQAGLKLREPKKDGIYQFKINNQYRVFGKFVGNDFYITRIYDHKR